MPLLTLSMMACASGGMHSGSMDQSAVRSMVSAWPDADDIVRGRRTVSEARQFYADQIAAMMKDRRART